WQAFAVVTDSSWTGVMGDTRAEGYVVIVRAVESEDGMTADWYRPDMDLLDRISKRIVNEVGNVTMVAYATTSKPPSTIEAC
ncbi:MAG: GMP synthase (glutamine-hydrolyzing), partial [Nitrososphaerota archaeon]